MTTSQIFFKSQVISSFLTTWCDPQRSVSPWSAWRPEASAPRKSRPRWVCRNRQRSGGKGGFFQQRSWDFDVCRSKIQRKNTSLTRHLTPWHSPQTPTAPQRQTTRGKTLLFCDASRTKNFEHPEPQKWARRSHKP